MISYCRIVAMFLHIGLCSAQVVTRIERYIIYGYTWIVCGGNWQ